MLIEHGPVRRRFIDRVRFFLSGRKNRHNISRRAGFFQNRPADFREKGPACPANFAEHAETQSRYRARYFLRSSGSDIIRRKTPPTTERAWKPTFFPSVVSYQSVSGTRVGVSLSQQ